MGSLFKKSLRQAVLEGDIIGARTAIAEGANPKGRDIDGTTPLHWVACKDNPTSLRLAEQFISQGADVNAIDNHERTPLHVAALCHLAVHEIAEYLISQGANVNAKDELGNTPLHYVLSSFVLSSLFAPPRQMAELLISKGADVNAKNKDGKTPLHGAVTLASCEGVDILLSKGADVNALTNSGVTPLDLAGKAEMKELIIKHGGQHAHQ